VPSDSILQVSVHTPRLHCVLSPVTILYYFISDTRGFYSRKNLSEKYSRSAVLGVLFLFL